MTVKYIPSGDSAFIIKTGDEISADTNAVVRKFLRRLEDKGISGVIDFIPSYNELMVCYDPSVTGYRELLEKIRSCEAELDMVEIPDPGLVQVPVLYGGEYGPDLKYVAEYTSLSEEEVIRIHCSTVCLVYMLGFTPGFCYLGGMDLSIATPRRQTPRVKIPAGSVGIADRQTGIYPVDSPGGWQLIGRTPLRLFDPDSKPGFLFSAGDYLQFYPVSEEEYNSILNEVNAGRYIVKRKSIR